MKTSRFKFEYRKSASKLHKKVGDLLRTSDIRHYEIYQEYPVNRVNKDYPHSSHHFDWVIPKLHVVIECHGKQHFEPTAWDGDDEKAISSFRSLRRRDIMKEEAARDAGYIYIAIPYGMEKELDHDVLLYYIYGGGCTPYKRRLEERGRTNLELLKEKKKAADKEARQKFLASDKHQTQLDRAREYRQRRYKELKQLKDGP